MTIYGEKVIVLISFNQCLDNIFLLFFQLTLKGMTDSCYVTDFCVGTLKRYTQEIFSTLKGPPITPTTWTKGVSPRGWPSRLEFV